MTLAHRDQAVNVIHTTSQMFKNVSHEQETTAALQADFLESLVAHQQEQPTSCQSAFDQGAWDQVNSSNDVSHNPDPSPNPGPLIDVTDFDSWLSAFELGTLADTAIDAPSWPSANMQAVNTTADIAPNTLDADWDAVSFNPSGLH